MRKILILIFSLFLFFTGYGQTEEKVSISGKLYKQSEFKSNCGIMAFATVMEFEVLNVYTDNFKKKNVLVIVPCAEVYGEKFFEIDKIYNLTLVKGNITNTDYILLDDPKRSSIIRKENEMWAIEIKKE
jgi:hypothetical protein